MTNDCIRIGLEKDACTLKRLSMLAYKELTERYGDEVPSYYRLCATSKAAGILAARKKSIRRGFPTGRPYLSKPVLVSCYGFKIDNGMLSVPLGRRCFESIKLNHHTISLVSKPTISPRSFVINENSLSICIAKKVEVPDDVRGVVGIDRNLRNVTVGNEEKAIYYDLSKAVEMAENTRSIIHSFQRNDVRIRRIIARKYGRRRQERVRQILNRISKHIVSEAKRNNQAIAFEDIKGINKLYRTGNGQGSDFRARMNSWPFGELKRQVEYKALWRVYHQSRYPEVRREARRWIARNAGRDSNRQSEAITCTIANCGASTARDGRTEI